MEKNCQIELYFDCVLISTHEVSIFLSTYTLSAASSKQRIFSCLLSMLHLYKYLGVLSYLKILSIYATYLGKHFDAVVSRIFCLKPAERYSVPRLAHCYVCHDASIPNNGLVHRYQEARLSKINLSWFFLIIA